MADTHHWKIGELAKATRLTVRTLHHYDEIGLLVPSQRTPAGHRLYTDADVRRLYRIVALRQLGLALDEVRSTLEREEPDAHTTVRRQLARVEQQLELYAQLRERLWRLLDVLEGAHSREPSTDHLVDVIERTMMIEDYYTPEQLAKLQSRREQVGEETIRGVEAEWPALYARAEAFAAEGRDPADGEVQSMLDRMDELVAMFHGGDPDIQASLQRLWDEQGEQMRQQRGPPPHVQAYLDRARAARGGDVAG